jgi:arsenate reductase
MKPKVLFLCTGNSARSQMAEGYLRHRAGDRFEGLSAGITPKGVNPLAIEAMREIGIDISRQTSKEAAQYLGTPIQYVVTVCDNAEHCPSSGTFKHLHCSDPAAVEGSHHEQLSAFRTVRDVITKRIDAELINQPQPVPKEK